MCACEREKGAGEREKEREKEKEKQQGRKPENDEASKQKGEGQVRAERTSLRQSRKRGFIYEAVGRGPTKVSSMEQRCSSGFSVTVSPNPRTWFGLTRSRLNLNWPDTLSIVNCF